jgi:hypothetical protein
MEPSNYANLNNVSSDATPVPSLRIKPSAEEIQADKDSKIIEFPVVLQSENLIPSSLSGSNPFALGYKIYKGKAEIAANSRLNPLEVDLKGGYQQNLTIEIPAEAGEYFIKPYLLPQDQNYWNQPLIKLIVD